MNKNLKVKNRWQPETKRHFNLIKGEFDIDAEAIHLLLGTMERYDRYYQCQRTLEKDGLTFKTQSGQVKVNPLVTEQKNAWAGYLAGIRALGLLNIEEPKQPPHRPIRSPGV